jgi:hypothetical protein
VVGLFLPLRRSSAEAVQRLQAAAADFRKAMPLNDEEVEAMVADFDALRRGRPLPNRGVKCWLRTLRRWHRRRLRRTHYRRGGRLVFSAQDTCLRPRCRH